MQPAHFSLARPGLNGSALVGLLAPHLAPPSAAPPSFVEGLGRWLGWKDAIALQAVLAAPTPTPALAPPGAVPLRETARALAALDAELTRLRASLAGQMQQALADAVRDDDGSFLPWRRAVFQLQQALAAAVGPLRATARQALQRLGTQHAALAGLARLAALDAVLEAALAPREQGQLAALPVLLEKIHQRHAGDAPALREALLPLLQAELELRLQPALGLLDALRATHTGSP